MTEQQRSAILQIVAGELEQNLGNRITAALANGMLHNIANQLPVESAPADNPVAEE